MADLLVRLYDLPEVDLKTVDAAGIAVRRALPPERRLVVDWVGAHFGSGWASECEVALSGHPVSVWIAARANQLLGFACTDATAKGFFGPTGVLPQERGRGLGTALLFAALRAMREDGYAYAVIGGAGPVAFYRRRLEVFEIPNSTPGIYRGMLSDDSGG